MENKQFEVVSTKEVVDGGTVKMYELHKVMKTRKESYKTEYNPTPDQWNFMATKYVTYDVPYHAYEWVFVGTRPSTPEESESYLQDILDDLLI